MRKITVFTGTRAEYGLLYWVIKALNEAPDVQLNLWVGGMHLSPEFGHTIDTIEQDGFPVSERLEFLLSSDTPVGITKSMALATISSGEAMDREKPDLLVLLGDRFEALAVAQAAMVSKVPIAHIHGGEATEGLIDEAVRHSLTKMSHLHFAATEVYRQRIIQLGEQPDRVFNVGAPGVDSAKRLPLLDRKDLPASISFDLSSDYFLVTFHPVTLEHDGESKGLDNLLQAINQFPQFQVVITFPNADTHGRALIKKIERFRDAQPDRVFVASSLGQVRYLSLMRSCAAVVGNSSSGLIEAPSFGVPTVNIGDRQRGRIAGETVVSCGYSEQSILEALQKAVSPEFRESCRAAVSPYGCGGASEKIVEVLKNVSLDGILKKKFYDLEVLK